MVRSFQKQQLDATLGLAASVEESVANVRRGLESLANHPDVCRLAPTMKDVLSSYLQQERAILDELVVVDTRNSVLWRSSSDVHGKPVNNKGLEGRDATTLRDKHRLVMIAPIKSDGRQVGTLSAAISMHRLAIHSQVKAANARGSIYWMLSDRGETIYSNTDPQERQVIYALRTAEAAKVKVSNADLLNYIAGQCVAAGNSGLVEVARQGDRVEELAAYAPINLEGRRFGLLVASPRAEVSIPIVSHERVTYALIVALALLYFATGYTAYRSERAHSQLEGQRRRAAEQASKAKSDFLAKRSHDIRTPMNGLISMTELALETDDEGERKRYMAVVKECANSLLSVINDILDMSKIEAGKLEICDVPLNVPECVGSTLASLAPLARSKSLSLRWDVESNTPSIVSGDPGRLRQVLCNLVGNAIKFTKTGEITVMVLPLEVRPDHAVLRFDVRDTGPGMSPEDQKRVFAPYYQSASHGRYRSDSTGLGLTITKHLVELMGGSISVSSEIGKGTTFTFTTKFNMVTGSDLTGRPESLPPLAGLRVLVISGIPANLQHFRDLLLTWGAEVDRAESSEVGAAAIGQARSRGTPYSLILFDGNGQSMDAFSFAEAASTLDGLEETALAVIYQAGFRGDAIRCLRAGIDAYISFPVDDDQLHVALQMAVQHATSQKGQSLVTKYSLPAGRPLTILLVEDNPVNRQAVLIILGQWDHKVHAVESGEEALAAMGARDFDLVLMDLEMPGMNGIEATAEIRRREQGSNRRTPIIAMTAHAMDSDVERCMEAGMDRYLSKPFRPDQLRRIIADVSTGVVGSGVRLTPSANASTPSRAGVAWDRAEATRLADGNSTTVDLIIKTFLADLRETLPKAERAALARDSATLAGLAHRWKGSLGLLGARSAQSSAVALENACRLGEPERLLECFDRLRQELLTIESAMSDATKENATCKSS